MLRTECFSQEFYRFNELPTLSKHATDTGILQDTQTVVRKLKVLVSALGEHLRLYKTEA